MTTLPAHEPHDPHDRWLAFRHMSFTLYWGARISNMFATQILVVAVGWQVYDLTRDPLDLGIVGLVQFLPALLLVLVTGTVADRFSRRWIMGVCTAIEGCCCLGVLLLTLDGLTSVLPVFGLLAVLGVARAFLAPASASLVANVVPTEHLANAVAWNSSAAQIGRIAGPVAGGLLYGVSPLAAYGSALALFLAASVLVLSVPKPVQRTSTEPATLKTVLAGFRYVYSEKIIFGAITLDLFAVLLGGAVALLPVYARDILELGPLGLGFLRAAPGIGAVATAVWLTAHPVRDHAGILMFVFVAGFGFFTVVFGVSTVAWLSIVALGLAGACDMVSVYIRMTLIQIWTPDALRGRVNAVNMMFIGASNELGEFRAGAMAAVIGTVGAVVVGGMGTLAIAGLWAKWFPELRGARHLDGRV